MGILLFLIGTLVLAIVGVYTLCGLWYSITVKLLGKLFGKEEERKMTYDEWLDEILMDNDKKSKR